MVSIVTNVSRWWSVTEFTEEGIEKLSSRVYPKFVKQVLGGKEQCPDTGRVHFQGAVNTQPCRFTQLKKWLPTAHIEVARQEQALKKYAMKEETAIEQKEIRHNERKYLSMGEALQLIARYAIDIKSRCQKKYQETNTECEYCLKTYADLYNESASAYMRDNNFARYEDISLLSNPQMISAWKKFWCVCIAKAQTELAYSITGECAEDSECDEVALDVESGGENDI